MFEKPLHFTQFLLGGLTLFLVLSIVLIYGGNTPIAWSLLSISVLLLLFLQVLMGLLVPVPLAVRRLFFPGLLFLAAMGWAWVQTWGGIPEDYSHPYWSFVPDAPAAISADPGQGRHAVMRLLCYATIFLVMVWTCVDDRGASLILKTVALFSAGHAGYGLFAFATGDNFFLGDSENSQLVQSTFVNRNSYATYAAFGTLANLAAFLHRSDRQADNLRGRIEGFFAVGAWIYAIGLLLCLGALSLTQSRAGAVSGLLGLAVFLVAWPRGNTGLWEKVMLALLAAVLVFIALTSATGLTERLLTTTEEEARFAIYPFVLQAIADRPILGHGLGSFFDAFRPYVPENYSALDWLRAHNTYLETVFGLGLPAAGAFFASLGLIALRLFRGTRTRRKNRAFSCFALGCVGIAALHSVFDFSLQMPAVAALFAAALGLGYAQSFTNAEIKKDQARQEIVDRN